MHILMISDVYFPRVNGVSTSIETFRQCLAGGDISIDLIAPQYPADRVDAGWVRRVASRAVPRDPEDRLMSYRGALAAGRTLLPDLIHIQTPFVAHYAGLRLARWHRVPVIATYHTLFEEYFHHYVRVAPYRLTAALARHYSRRQCNALGAVIVPSSAMHRRLLEYGVKVPIHVLPTGIPLASFATGDGAAFRERHGIEAGRPLALFVGRIAGEKNIDFLLHVAARCRQRLPRLLWIIAGDGPALPHLRQLAQRLGVADCVRFLGYLDRARQLADCYAAADVFTFASRTETQGLVLLEAMAAGLPVVALAEMGTRDILEPRRGACVPAADVEAFAATVTDLLNDGRERLRLAEEARIWAREWSDVAMAERLAGLYRGLRFVNRLQPAAA